MTNEVLRVRKINPKLLKGLGGIKEFTPFARFIKSLNCIEILTRDCSFCEKRITSTISVLIDNEKKDCVGFVLWGVQTHFAENYLGEGFQDLIELIVQLVFEDYKARFFAYGLRSLEFSIL